MLLTFFAASLPRANNRRRASSRFSLYSGLRDRGALRASKSQGSKGPLKVPLGSEGVGSLDGFVTGLAVVVKINGTIGRPHRLQGFKA
jgi:hypothetical protein